MTELLKCQWPLNAPFDCQWICFQCVVWTAGTPRLLYGYSCKPSCARLG